MFTGEKVRLREYRREDLELALKYINDEEIKRDFKLGIPFPLTTEDENKWFESLSAGKDTYIFAIETLDEGLYIGGCGINEIFWKNSIACVEILIGNKDYRGRGYGTDAMNVLVRFIFEQMNINKVKLTVHSFNERAINSYKKCGFVVEGVLRQEIFRNGKFYDSVAMSILREEYFNRERQTQ